MACSLSTLTNWIRLIRSIIDFPCTSSRNCSLGSVVGDSACACFSLENLDVCLLWNLIGIASRVAWPFITRLWHACLCYGF